MHISRYICASGMYKGMYICASGMYIGRYICALGMYIGRYICASGMYIGRYICASGMDIGRYICASGMGVDMINNIVCVFIFFMVDPELCVIADFTYAIKRILGQVFSIKFLDVLYL